MDDHELIETLRALPGEGPSGDFSRELLLHIDLAADDYDDGGTATAESGDTETADTIVPLSLEGHRVARRRLPFPMLVAAAVAVVVAIVGGVLLATHTPDETVVASDVAVEQLLAAAAEPGLAIDARLAYLAEAAALDASGASLPELGVALADAGLLAVDSSLFAELESFALSPDGATIVVVRDALDEDGTVRASGGLLQVWDIGADTRDLALPTQPAAVWFDTSGNLVLWPTKLQTERYRSGDFEPLERDPIPLNRDDGGPAVGVVGPQLETEIVLFDRATGDVLRSVEVARAWEFQVVASPGASIVVAQRAPGVGEPEPLVVWETDTDLLRTDHPLNQLGPATTDLVSFSPDGRFVAVGLQERIVVLDAATFTPVRELAQADAIRLEFVGDEATLVVQSAGSLAVWDAGSGTALLSEIAIDDRRHLDSAGRLGLAPTLSVSPESGLVAAVSAVNPDMVEVWSLDPRTWIDLACAAARPLTTDERSTVGLADSDGPCT